VEWYLIRGKKVIIIMILRILCVTRVNSTNVLDEGLRIGGRGCWMNSKVKIQTKKARLDAC
jgi:hypothetical protein